MPRAKQLSLWVPDKVGMLGEVAGALGEKKVNIRAIMAATEGGRGAIRMVVDKPAAARKIFTSRGWQTTEEEVVEVTLPDSPGSLGKLASKLGKAGVNIEYIYAGSGGGARKLNAYLGVADIKAALKAAR
ncbi:MAG: ACT domain-containing protein [Chloroflexi bacterium]|nr:MAG: amino acid-binding protein [Actinobacteria bacterium 13_2_20CM_2_66_6]TMD35365.1 MAG: ACT domain-containing protein [Chloroflexota bacterium]TMD73960.1 MAG: ACT domain-containing protein [Chloroflexota bacterium]